MLVKCIAAYTHLSSTVYELKRDIGRKLQLFPIHLACNAPIGVFPLEFLEKFGPQKTRIMGLPDSEDSLLIGWAVSTQYQRVTDGRTDRRPAYSYNMCSMTDAVMHVKNEHKYEPVFQCLKVADVDAVQMFHAINKKLCL